MVCSWNINFYFRKVSDQVKGAHLGKFAPRKNNPLYGITAGCLEFNTTAN